MLHRGEQALAAFRPFRGGEHTRAGVVAVLVLVAVN